MRPLAKLTIVVALQLLVLVSLIGFKQYTIWTSDTVLLKVQPMDPRDLLPANYTSVQFGISELDLDQLAGDDEAIARVYVELQRGDDGYWEPVALHDNKRIHTFDGTVLIEGRQTQFEPSRNIMHVLYGIEGIFIPEGSASQLPAGSGHTVAVEVRVDRWGQPVARAFLVDGQRFPLKRR